MALRTQLRNVVLALGVACALPASAAFYVDDTTGAPTFNRALADFSGLSAVGTDVAYDVFSFSVSQSGDYEVRSFVQGFLRDPSWDQFLFLYEDSFDPLNALSNGLIANDDLGDDIDNLGRSGFTVELLTGTAYYLVTTGFGNDDSGRFLNLVRGPGDILPAIPEPGTYAMLAMGLLAVSAAVSRRRRQPDA
jgi:hypothetical protein